MSDEKNSISVKELAAKLKVSDALLKKLVKDFGIDTQKIKNRVHLPDNSVQTVREIMALRASGKKNSEIKEMFDASQGTEKVEAKPETNEETKEAKATKKDSKKDDKKKEPKAKDSKKKDEKAKDSKKRKTKAKDKEEDSEETDEEPKAEKEDKKDSKKSKEKSKKDDKRSSKKQRKVKGKKDSNKQGDEPDEDDGGLLNLNEYIEDNETENDLKSRLDVDDEDDLEEAALDDIDDEDFDDEEEDDDDEPEAKSSSKGGKSAKKNKFRRRQFSYKYIQRQILNDQKRVKYIQQKLKRSRLSTAEKMKLEESLEIRDKLLSGWIKLLRWVKS